MLDEILKDVAVIGAAGKMGSGIALLLSQEMALSEVAQSGRVGSGDYTLTLIDMNEKGWPSLKKYLSGQLLKFAEKNINSLRRHYAKRDDLISNEEIIQDFVQGALGIVVFDNNIQRAKKSSLIFEVIIESLEQKIALYSELKAICKKDTIYMTNTSSIPIWILNNESHLDNRILGFHFYNPPAIQKLVEVVLPEPVDSHLKDIVADLGKRLKKILVYAHDVAGFIGNGHFLRETVFACEQVAHLSHQQPQSEAVYMINKVTQDFLIRPMGIFQLIDYVGIDVVSSIGKVMGQYITETFNSPLIEEMLKAGIKGGQNPDGSQKDGFFKYDKLVPIAAYSFEDKKYTSFHDAAWVASCDAQLGALPEGWLPWKKLVSDPQKDSKIKSYLDKLFSDTSFGAELAKKYLTKSQEIEQKLVKDEVANKIEDVSKVLELGFMHAYDIDHLIPVSK